MPYTTPDGQIEFADLHEHWWREGASIDGETQQHWGIVDVLDMLELRLTGIEQSFADLPASDPDKTDSRTGNERVYLVRDEETLYRDSGTGWVPVTGGVYYASTVSRARDILSDLGAAGGGMLILRKGSYDVAGTPLKVPDNVTLMGSGHWETVIVDSGNLGGRGAVETPTETVTKHAAVRNLHFDGCHFVSQKAAECLVEDCLVTNDIGGIKFEYLPGDGTSGYNADVSRNVIRNCVSVNCGQEIMAQQGDRPVITGCIVYNPDANASYIDAIHFEDSNDILCANNYVHVDSLISNSKARAIKTQNCEGVVVGNWIKNMATAIQNGGAGQITIAGNVARSVNKGINTGTATLQGRGGVIAGNVLDGAATNANTTDGIGTEEWPGVIANNLVQGFERGIHPDDARAITGNVVRNISGYGIRNADVDDEATLISGNWISDCAGGISVRHVTDQTAVITNNTIRNSTAGTNGHVIVEASATIANNIVGGQIRTLGTLAGTIAANRCERIRLSGPTADTVVMCNNVISSGNIDEQDTSNNNHIWNNRVTGSITKVGADTTVKNNIGVPEPTQDLSTKTPGWDGQTARDDGTNFTAGEYAYADTTNLVWRAFSDPANLTVAY